MADDTKKTPAAEPVALPETDKPAASVLTAAFIWRGPVEAVRLMDGDAVVFEGVLSPGKTVELPKTHSSVAAWVATGAAKPVQSSSEKEA